MFLLLSQAQQWNYILIITIIIHFPSTITIPFSLAVKEKKNFFLHQIGSSLQDMQLVNFDQLLDKHDILYLHSLSFSMVQRVRTTVHSLHAHSFSLVRGQQQAANPMLLL